MLLPDDVNDDDDESLVEVVVECDPGFVPDPVPDSGFDCLGPVILSLSQRIHLSLNCDFAVGSCSCVAAAFACIIMCT